MVNVHYRRGVRVERIAQKEFEERGYLVVRSSGSHSLFDLVCIPMAGFGLSPDVLGLQLKCTAQFDKSSYKKDLETLRAFRSACPLLVACLWVWEDYSGWVLKAEFHSPCAPVEA